MKGIKKWPPNLCVNKTRLFIGFDYRQRASRVWRECQKSPFITHHAFWCVLAGDASIQMIVFRCAASQHKICTAGSAAKFITRPPLFAFFRLVSLHLSGLIWQKLTSSGEAVTTQLLLILGPPSSSSLTGSAWHTMQPANFSFDDP